jgi:hypothetical protein
MANDKERDATMTECEHKWISVDERMPASGLVLACTAREVMVLAGWSEKDQQWSVPEWFGGSNNGNRSRECFSHWMPLPAPPETSK